ncbi:hypothetical protein D3C75_775090 [compost metagenome]
MASLVLQHGEVDLGQLGEAVFDVADGARGLADGGGYAVVLRRLDELVGGRPVDGVAFAQPLLEVSVDGRQVLGEYRSGTAGVGTHDHGDRGGWQFQLRVGRDDLRVVPLGDLAEEDVGVHIARQLQPFRVARQVVSQDDFTGGHWQQLHALADLGDFFGFHCRVAGGEVDGLVQKVLNTRPAPLGLVVNGDTVGFLAEGLEPGQVDRCREAGAGTGQADVLCGKGCRGGAKRNGNGECSRLHQAYHRKALRVMAGTLCSSNVTAL